jgi:hypothetical protein
LKKNQLCEVSTMDDLQFRRGIYSDPHNKDNTFSDEVLAEINSNPAKKQLSNDIKQLDNKIAKAMNVEVPENLVDKLILRQTLANHQQQKRKSKIYLALAASVVFAIGLTFNFMQSSSAYDSLGDYALAHVHYEETHFNNNMDAKITLASLNKKMASFDGSFLSSVGQLISAEYCRFDGMKSLHLVFQGKTDIVTIFVVPKNDNLSFDDKFTDEKLKGTSQRFENGNIIIVANLNESLNKWQNTINDNIQWSI